MDKEKINKKINFVELIQKHPESVEILMESGMHCIGCHAAMYESLEEGAIAHGLDPDRLVKEINERLIKNGRDNIRERKKSNSKQQRFNSRSLQRIRSYF